MSHHFALTPTDPGISLADTDDWRKAEHLAWYYFRYGGKNGGKDSMSISKADLRIIVVAASTDQPSTGSSVYWFLEYERSDTFWLNYLGLGPDAPRLLYIGSPQPLAMGATLATDRSRG